MGWWATGTAHYVAVKQVGTHTTLPLRKGKKPGPHSFPTRLRCTTAGTQFMKPVGGMQKAKLIARGLTVMSCRASSRTVGCSQSVADPGVLTGAFTLKS
jgi:hypothetical protein